MSEMISWVLATGKTEMFELFALFFINVFVIACVAGVVLLSWLIEVTYQSLTKRRN